MGAKRYNDLPLQIRKTDNYDSFDNRFDGQFLTLYIHILFNQCYYNIFYISIYGLLPTGPTLITDYFSIIHNLSEVIILYKYWPSI